MISEIFSVSGFMPQKRLDSTFVYVYTKTDLMFRFDKKITSVSGNHRSIRSPATTIAWREQIYG
ncbi:hypothetical protein FACS1894120_4960 [Clostridia bacterium]|nr:hypothetical protein FACS1894120_4960 [Clostridia bacterium]